MTILCPQVIHTLSIRSHAKAEIFFWMDERGEGAKQLGVRMGRVCNILTDKYGAVQDGFKGPMVRDYELVHGHCRTIHREKKGEQGIIRHKPFTRSPSPSHGHRARPATA